MKNFRFFMLIVILSTIILPSCTERIDLKLDESYVRLVVDGAITTDTLAHKVKLTKTSSYYFNEPAQVVTGAILSISDGNTTYSLSETAPGVYQTNGDVFGIAGKTYTLDIQLAQEIGGYSEYEAQSQLVGIGPLDSVNLLFHPDWTKTGLWEVKCYVQEPPTTDYYRFMVYRNQTLITDTLNEWFITDDKFFNGNYTNGATVAYLQSGDTRESIQKGDTVTVEVNNINKAYYNFLLEAQSELRGSNPLFSGPPANIKGNVNHGAIGFFAAYSATRSWTVASE